MPPRIFLKPPTLVSIGMLLGGSLGAQHFEYKEHHLGPTGLFGVTSPTDIKVTKVEPGSPSDGKLKEGDVIVAAAGSGFQDNTRPLFAAAIDQAETEQAKGLLTLSLVKDKKLFYAVAHKLMDHKRASGRTSGTALILKVPLADFHWVADKVQYIIDDKDLTYHSYHNLGAKTNCIAILANLNIKGGIEAAFATLDDPNGKAGFKIRLIMDVLPRYGANARYILPKIKGNDVGKFQKQWDEMVKQIETAPPATQKMITLEEAKRLGLN